MTSGQAYEGLTPKLHTSEREALEAIRKDAERSGRNAMDMQTLRLETREGDRVRWVPTQANGDPNSAYCSDGTISRFDGQRVMVKLDAAVEVDGFEAAQEVAIDPQALRVL